MHVIRQYRYPRGIAAIAAVVALLSIGHTAIAQSGTATASSRAVYYVAEVDVRDAEGMKPYAVNVPMTVELYGGVFVARGGKTQALEGASPKRIVIIKFKSMEDATRWYNSPEYAAIRPYRLKAGETRNFLVEALN